MALYDPNEFPETKSNTDDLVPAFLAWARSKPADEEYCYYDAGNCAVAQFGRATGRDHLVGVGELCVEHPVLDRLVNPLEEDWTFGALVKRIEALS